VSAGHGKVPGAMHGLITREQIADAVIEGMEPFAQ